MNKRTKILFAFFVVTIGITAQSWGMEKFECKHAIQTAVTGWIDNVNMKQKRKAIRKKLLEQRLREQTKKKNQEKKQTKLVISKWVTNTFKNIDMTHTCPICKESLHTDLCITQHPGEKKFGKQHNMHSSCFTKWIKTLNSRPIPEDFDEKETNSASCIACHKEGAALKNMPLKERLTYFSARWPLSLIMQTLEELEKLTPEKRLSLINPSIIQAVVIKKLTEQNCPNQEELIRATINIIEKRIDPAFKKVVLQRDNEKLTTIFVRCLELSIQDLAVGILEKVGETGTSEEITNYFNIVTNAFCEGKIGLCDAVKLFPALTSLYPANQNFFSEKIYTSFIKQLLATHYTGVLDVLELCGAMKKDVRKKIIRDVDVVKCLIATKEKGFTTKTLNKKITLLAHFWDLLPEEQRIQFFDDYFKQGDFSYRSLCIEKIGDKLSTEKYAQCVEKLLNTTNDLTSIYSGIASYWQAAPKVCAVIFDEIFEKADKNTKQALLNEFEEILTETKKYHEKIDKIEDPLENQSLNKEQFEQADNIGKQLLISNPNLNQDDFMKYLEALLDVYKNEPTTQAVLLFQFYNRVEKKKQVQTLSEKIVAQRTAKEQYYIIDRLWTVLSDANRQKYFKTIYESFKDDKEALEDIFHEYWTLLSNDERKIYREELVKKSDTLNGKRIMRELPIDCNVNAILN